MVFCGAGEAVIVEPRRLLEGRWEVVVGMAIWCREGSSMKVGEVLSKARMPWTRLVKTASFRVVSEEVDSWLLCLLVRANVRRVDSERWERVSCWSSKGRVSSLGVESVIVVGIAIVRCRC